MTFVQRLRENFSIMAFIVVFVVALAGPAGLVASVSSLFLPGWLACVLGVLIGTPISIAACDTMIGEVRQRADAVEAEKRGGYVSGSRPATKFPQPSTGVRDEPPETEQS